mgnify:CR=1 FL=1
MTLKYEELVQTLRQTLPRWYADGQRKLPSEQELSAQFSVSRQTLRQALAELKPRPAAPQPAPAPEAEASEPQA